MKHYVSSSSEETKEFAEAIARNTTKKGTRRTTKSALVFALTGELGSGKTTFVQGFLRGLGVKRGGASPTFIIFRRHKIRSSKFRNAYHVDAYRLRKAKELKVLEFEKILENPRNIVVVEWAEKIRRILPSSAVWLKFQHGKKENERRIGFLL